MGLIVLLGLGTLAYLYVSGQLTRHLSRLLGAGALGFVAARLFFGGRPLAGLIVAAVALTLAMWDRRPGAYRSIEIAEARAILGVDQAADANDIQAAYRRLIAQVHPDKGGSAELARRVNAARDVLLAIVNRTPPGAS